MIYHVVMSDFSKSQAKELIQGMKDRVAWWEYADPNLSAKQMKLLREFLHKKEPEDDPPDAFLKHRMLVDELEDFKKAGLAT